MKGIYPFLFLALALLPAAAPAVDGEVAEMFRQANEAYGKGQSLAGGKRQPDAMQKLGEAARLYEEILASGFVSWPILYNLGNAHYRRGRIGKAIVNYRRAERLAPREPAVQANLRQARQQIRDRELSSDLPSFFQSLVFCYYRLNLNEAMVFALSLYFAFCLGEVIYIFTKHRYAKYATIVFLALTVLSTVSVLLKFRNEYYRPQGVVIAPECPVRVGPGKEQHVLFTAHEGADVIVEEERPGSSLEKRWLKVKVLIETEERTEKETRRLYGPVGYVQSSNVELL
ncbi:MAG: tetratricopeptide repeat protein [Planctomycetes bacterium]|nr:tetratricopeptide repeat protein [Planctomycetota bacterium]